MSNFNPEFISANESLILPIKKPEFVLPSHLTLSSHNFTRLFSHLSDPALLIDTQGKILDANERACSFLGVAKDHLLERTISQYFVAQKHDVSEGLNLPVRDSCSGRWRLIEALPTVPPLHFSLLANVGQDIHLLMLQSDQTAAPTVGPTATESAPPTSACNTCHTLSDAAAELHWQWVALNACANVIMITDRNGTITWVNPAFTQLTGYTPAEAIGHNPRELLNSGQQDHPFFQQLWQTITAGQVWQGELINRRKDHTHYVAAMTITPVYNDDQEITHFIAVKQDITERKQAEHQQQALTNRVNDYARALEQANLKSQLSEQRYRHVLDTQTELLCRFTPDGVLTFVNGAYCRLFGRSPQELVGKSFLELVPPPQSAQVRAQLAELQQLTVDQPTVTHEHQVITPAGLIAWHQWVNQALFDERGRLIEIQASGRDITELKQAEQQLRDRERQLDLFFTQSLDGFFFMMLDEPCEWHDGIDKAAALDYIFVHQRATKANQAFLDQYGFSEADFIGLTPQDFFAHDLATGRAIWQQLFDTGRLHIDTNEMRQDGTPIWIEGDYICLYDDAGRITGHFGVQRDVTAMRDAVKALSERERQYRLLVENQTDLVVKVDADGHFLFVSPSYCELFGQPAETLLAQDFVPLVHPDDRAATQQAIEALWQPPHTCTLEQRALTRQGWRWIAWADTAILDESGRVTAITGIGRDITDRKQMELELQLSEQRFRNVLETLTLVAIMIDTQGNILFCNDALLSLTGWQREEVLGRSWWHLFVPDEIRSAVQELFERTIDTADFPAYYENEIVMRGGDRRLIAWNNTVQHSTEGAVISLTGIGEDITDRKRNEQRIHELSQRLSLATASATIGVWDLNYSTGRCMWDERMYEIYGLPADTGLIEFDHWLATYVHPEDVDIIEGSEAAIRAGANHTQLEFRIIRADGEIRYIEAHTAVVRDAEGGVRRLIGLNQDVSDRLKNATILQETTQRLTLATEAAELGIWEWDIASDRTVWDERMHEIYGIAPADFSGLHNDWFNTIHPDDRALMLQQGLALSQNRDRFHAEFRIVRPSGEVRHIESYGYLVRDADGQPVRAIGANRDISDRKQSELALAETHEMLNALMQNSPAMMGLYDETGRYLKVNAVTADFLGKPVGEIEGSRFEELLSWEVAALYRTRIRQSLATNQPIVIEDRLRGDDDQEHILQSILFPVWSRPGHPKLLGFVATDITDLVTAQDYLRQQAERERLLREITSNIRRSLDLDTVLNSTVTGIREFLASDRVLIYQFAADWSGDIIVESVGPEWSKALNETLRDPCFANQWIEPYRQGRIHQIADVESADIPSCYQEFLQHYQVRANLALPIVVNDQLWGLLCIHQCRAPRQWQSDVVDFVRQLCDQVEIAIQQALLLQETNIRMQREQVLNEIVSDIRDSLDLPEILEGTTQKLLETFRVGRCVISLLAEGDEYFEYLATTAQPGIAPLRGRRVAIRESPHTRQVLAQAAPIASTDVMQDPLFAGKAAYLSQQLQIGAMLSVSIRHENQVKGMLCVQHPVPRQWTDHECTLINQVANQLAIAIQQAELYQQAQVEIAQRQHLENQLRHDALHDSLTGLPNRALFLERLQLALQRYQRRQYATPNAAASAGSAEFAVLFLDLDRFKVINDSLGHAFGDLLLQLVAERLTNCLRDVDIAARLGGDEFVVLLEDLSDSQLAIDVARRIHTVLELPIFLDNREVFIRASIGITFCSGHYDSPEQILQNADIAMYEAKKSNAEYIVFDASMHAIALEQMNLEHDLRHAIKREEFRLHFQPIVALSTGKIIGFEALVRWQHPTRGLLYPGAFVEVAEETGLVAAIDLWVLQQACQQLSQWHRMDAACKNLSISVNLSGRQFSQPDLIKQIDQALVNADLDGKHLKLEITESVLITNSFLAVQTLNEFRARNIQVCMDDFGTGYSSLSYLHQFPVDILKVDKSFILNLNSQWASSRDYEIVKAIIQLALNLNLKVIAEGIENHDVLVYLQKNNCQFGQGYHFAPALEAATATDLLLHPSF